MNAMLKAADGWSRAPPGSLNIESAWDKTPACAQKRAATGPMDQRFGPDRLGSARYGKGGFLLAQSYAGAKLEYD